MIVGAGLGDRPAQQNSAYGPCDHEAPRTPRGFVLFVASAPQTRRARAPDHKMTKPRAPAGPLRIADLSALLSLLNHAENDEPQPHVLFTFGLPNLKPEPCRPST